MLKHFWMLTKINKCSKDKTLSHIIRKVHNVSNIQHFVFVWLFVFTIKVHIIAGCFPKLKTQKCAWWKSSSSRFTWEWYGQKVVKRLKDKLTRCILTSFGIHPDWTSLIYVMNKTAYEGNAKNQINCHLKYFTYFMYLMETLCSFHCMETLLYFCNTIYMGHL